MVHGLCRTYCFAEFGTLSFCHAIGCALGLVARATVHLVGGVDAQPALGLGWG